MTELKRRLAAFDFDQTIVNENTDAVVRALIDRKQIPIEIEKLVETEGWTKYMQEIFRLLNVHNISKDKILNTVVEMNEVPGMVKCLKTLHQNNFDIIIISDSNTQFINFWNQKHGLDNFIYKVYTNPAYFDNGLLVIKPFDHQLECELSATNLCKGKVLERFITERRLKDNVKYQNVFYIGDGTNDICPILRLSETDFGCPRSEYSMDKKIVSVANKFNLRLSAQLIKWSSGFELMGKILSVIGK